MSCDRRTGEASGRKPVPGINEGFEMTVRPSENDRMKCVQTSPLVNGSPVGPPLDAVQSISQVDPRKEWVGGRKECERRRVRRRGRERRRPRVLGEIVVVVDDEDGRRSTRVRLKPE